MNFNVKTSHVLHKLQDYTLDLLPLEEEQAVARHIAGCEECSQALSKEREIGRLVHHTLNSATKPDYGRLQSLMPPMPNRRSPILAVLAPHKQWAVACLLLVFMMGAFLFGSDHNFTRLTSDQAATISFVDAAGTAETITTSEAGTLFSMAAQPTVPVEHSREFINHAPERNNPPAAPLPVAPQVTPAPAATYFQ